MSYKVMVLGSGGREHALCWKLAQSDLVSKIYAAPGNGGTARELKTENIPVAVSDFPALIDFAHVHQIDLTVVGPDNPLAEGIVDAFRNAKLRIFGPEQKAARLESSKVFAKQFMDFYNLPTARFGVFDNPQAAFEFCQTNNWARIVKVDGLALGKGVYVCNNLDGCERALIEIFTLKRFGNAGARVVVEERLNGPEISLMVLCDGNKMLPLDSSQDYKRRFDENQGPNTGGMGSYSPVPMYKTYEARIYESILTPLEKALQAGDITYKGLLYIGLMIHQDTPYILEFNSRFGDPETQCVLPRLENDLFLLLEASVEGALDKYRLSWSDKKSVCVVAVNEEYPDKSSCDIPIEIGRILPETVLFHAGTRLTDDGTYVTQGGRILNIVALGDSFDLASQKAYSALNNIKFTNMAFRKDIGLKVEDICLLK